MEPATEASDNPPSYHGNISMTDSPDTLSMCSDAFTDELDISASSPGVRDVGDHHGDEDVAKELKKQWSGDISFEGMLMSAAAAAKKFTAERQMGMNKLKRSQSVDSQELEELSQPKMAQKALQINTKKMLVLRVEPALMAR